MQAISNENQGFINLTSVGEIKDFSTAKRPVISSEYL